MSGAILQKPLRRLLEEIDDPRREIILQIYEDHKDLFHYAAGSSNNHQAWEGGYADHIAECLRVNDITYDALASMRGLGFTKASAAIVLFLHDIEKPFRYGPADDPRCKPWQEKFETAESWEKAKWDILAQFNKHYGIELTPDEKNGIKYTHGEGEDHRKNMRVSTPLAAHAHHCDNSSARIWPNDGKGLSI